MTMKKMIILLAVICLLGAGLFAYSGSRNRSALVDGQEAAAEPAAAESADAAEQVPAGEVPAAAGEAEEETVVRTLDYEAMYAAHDPNDVVAEIDGRDETWGSYFYSLYSQCGQIENYFNMMAMYYGYGMDWLDPVDDEGTTYADAALENWVFMIFLPIGAILLLLHTLEYLMKVYAMKEEKRKGAGEA